MIFLPWSLTGKIMINVQDVVFIDDRLMNVENAKNLKFEAILFESR